MSHGHSHCCDHNSESRGRPASEAGVQFSLYQKIDLENVECLNEREDGSGRKVFKPWERRHDKTEYVESDADAELLFNIPFTGNVKLKGIIVIGGEDDSHPNKMRLFKNREHMTFDATRSKADQEFELVRDEAGEVEYATKVVSFSSVHHLSLHFPSTFGSDTSKVYYVGLRGDFTEATRVGVVNAVYEARALPQDHKAGNEDLVAKDNSSY